jgi:oligopeptide transport system ATP-binding protein
MRQRVMIAIAMSFFPKLLIADEPTTALDVTIQAQILDLMKDIKKKYNMSILLITHDLRIVAGIADRICVMYGGKIVEFGTVEKIYQNPSHPYTKALLQSLPTLDMDRDKELIPIPGNPPLLSIHSAQCAKGCLFAPRCKDKMQVCTAKTPPVVSLNDEQSAACWLHAKEK